MKSLVIGMNALVATASAPIANLLSDANTLKLYEINPDSYKSWAPNRLSAIHDFTAGRPYLIFATQQVDVTAVFDDLGSEASMKIVSSLPYDVLGQVLDNNNNPLGNPIIVEANQTTTILRSELPQGAFKIGLSVSSSYNGIVNVQSLLIYSNGGVTSDFLRSQDLQAGFSSTALYGVTVGDNRIMLLSEAASDNKIVFENQSDNDFNVLFGGQPYAAKPVVQAGTKFILPYSNWPAKGELPNDEIRFLPTVQANYKSILYFEGAGNNLSYADYNPSFLGKTDGSYVFGNNKSDIQTASKYFTIKSV